MDGASFLTYVEHFLAPALHQGDVVVLDNLASHKVAGVKEAIERAGATLRYLPAYSPDLNPIEQVFAKLKAALRKAAARTFDALIEAIAQALADFTACECTNYLANSGYAANHENALASHAGLPRQHRASIINPSRTESLRFNLPAN